MGEELAGLADFAEPAISAVGDFFGGGGGDAVAGGLAGGAGEAAGSAFGGGAGDFAFNPGFSPSDFDYLSGGSTALSGGDAAGAAGASGGGFDPATSSGSSAFDPASFSGTGATGTGATTPDWLNGSSMFDTGVAGAAPAADFSGGVGSFGAPGVSSFNDSIAAAAAAPQNLTAFETGSSFGNGSPSAFSPSPSITAPDISTIDPTAQGGTSGSTDFSSVNRSASGGQAPVDLSGLDAAQTSAANQYAAVNANSVPTAAGDVGPNTAAAATPAAATSTPAAAADSSSGKFLGMDIGKPTVLGSAGTLLSGGLLASNLLRNSVPGQSQVNAINSTIPQIQSTIDSVNKTAADLRASTAPLNADAQAMMSYVSQGTLPPSMQAQVSAGVQSAKSQAASIMAQHGLSADPAKNAQLKQQFDTIDSQALQLQGTLANQLYQSGLAAVSASNQTQSVAANLQSTGLNALGLTQNTYLALQKIYADQDKQTRAAVTNFATALGRMSGGSGGGTTIKIGS